MQVFRRLISRSPQYLATGAVILAASLVGVLAIQKRALRSEVVRLQQQLEWLHPGFPLATTHARTLDGEPVVLGNTAAGRRQVLFFFNTTCPFCIESLEAWKRLANQIATRDDADVEVYGVSFHSDSLTRGYVVRHNLRFPIVVAADGKLAPVYRIRGVPVTAVLDHTGTVLYAGRGSLRRSPEIVDSVHQVLARTAPR